MTRKQFIESQGATCKNWTWSWSFVNHDGRFVIFGAWDKYTKTGKALILAESWMHRNGRRNPGYTQALKHIRLIEEQGYALKTFPMTYEETPDGEAVRIKDFTPSLSDKKLWREGGDFVALDLDVEIPRLAEEMEAADVYPEGASVRVTINAFERNPRARDACIAHHGVVCCVCGFDFESVYGELGKGFIHVHHIRPIGTIGAEYEVDPIKDLIPVCPNCHAMLHRKTPPLRVDALRSRMNRVR